MSGTHPDVIRRRRGPLVPVRALCDKDIPILQAQMYTTQFPVVVIVISQSEIFAAGIRKVLKSWPNVRPVFEIRPLSNTTPPRDLAKASVVLTDRRMELEGPRVGTLFRGAQKEPFTNFEETNIILQRNDAALRFVNFLNRLLTLQHPKLPS